MSKNTEEMRKRFKTESGQINVSLNPYFENLLFKCQEHLEYESKARTIKHGLLDLALKNKLITMEQYLDGVEFHL